MQRWIGADRNAIARHRERKVLHSERIEDRITTADTMVPLPTREAFAVDRQWPRTMLTALKGWWDRFCEYEKKDDLRWSLLEI